MKEHDNDFRCALYRKNSPLPVYRVVLHLLEAGLRDDGGSEGVVSNSDGVPLDLPETLDTIYIPTAQPDKV